MAAKLRDFLSRHESWDDSLWDTCLETKPTSEEAHMYRACASHLEELYVPHQDSTATFTKLVSPQMGVFGIRPRYH